MLGDLNWNGNILTRDGDSTDKSMIRFDNGTFDNCVIAGNAHADPILVCHGNEARASRRLRATDRPYQPAP